MTLSACSACTAKLYACSSSIHVTPSGNGIPSVCAHVRRFAGAWSTSASTSCVRSLTLSPESVALRSIQHGKTRPEYEARAEAAPSDRDGPYSLSPSDICGARQHSTFRPSYGRSILAVVANQVVRRTIVTEFWFGFGLDLRDDALRQDLTQLHAPLVEGIDIPNYALGEHRVFVERHQFPQGFRCQSFSQDRVRRTIALENAVRNQPAWSAFRRDLLGSLAERQRLGLRADVGNEHVVMAAKWIERLYKSDEVARDEPGPLVNQLVERVLAIRSWFAPVDRSCLVCHVFPIERDMLAIAFHRQLLEVGWKPLKVLLVGQDRHGLRPKEIAVPDAEKTHEHRKVLLEGSRAEVFVHLVQSAQHGAKIVRAD